MIEKNTILIVDDDQNLRNTLSDILTAKGYLSLHVATGRQALKKASESMPDVALIDIRLEDMSGLDVMKRIKVCSSNTECILITGHASQASAIEAINVGAYSYILKPYDIDQLLLTVQRAVEKGKTDKALQKSEAHYRQLFNSLPYGGEILDMEGRIINCSLNTSRMLGYEMNELIGAPIANFIDGDMLQFFNENYSEILKGESLSLEGSMIHKNGSKIDVFRAAQPIFNTKGEVVEVLALSIDITKCKHAEAEKVRMEEQLRQAQKMESVGRLAGGVAHDYNNALSVIIGFTEMAMDDLDPDGLVHANLTEVLTAAKRAADITRQLLAFARKQTINPKIIDLNEKVENTLKMLRHLIGEDIDLAWLPGKCLWPVKIDASQIDQILANLCVNARDAIEGVGKITIETGNITFNKTYCAGHTGFVTGEFIALVVSDNGCGMDKKILENVVEPFFTTKYVDKGTGLGLATTYGIVKQNNGFINIYSEPGKGTAIKIYLPRHEGKAVMDKKEPAKKSKRGLGETIFLVEDDLSILKLVRKILYKLGYTVLTAGTPEEALRLAEEYSGEIHMLITDVIMPEMDGRNLAERLQSLYPGLKCMFMSGYTANTIAHHGVLNEGVYFIQKPFSKEDLGTAIRKVLGN